MPVLSAQTERGIAVTSRLGCDLDSQLCGTRDGALDVFDRGGDRDSYRCVGQALVEGIDIGTPVGGALSISWDPGGFEAVIDGGALVEGRG